MASHPRASDNLSSSEEILPSAKASEETSKTVPHWSTPLNPNYRYLQSACYSESKYYKEWFSKDKHGVVANQNTSKTMEKLNMHPHPTGMRSSQAEGGDAAASLGDAPSKKCADVVSVQQIMMMKPVQKPSSDAVSQEEDQRMDPARSNISSTQHYTREQLLEMIAFHQAMACTFRELKNTAHQSPMVLVEGAGCSQESQRKRVGTHKSTSSDEPPQKKSGENVPEGFVLSEDAIERLSAMASIWDMAVEMGILNVQEAAFYKSIYCDTRA